MSGPAGVGEFARTQRFTNKGALCVALVVTEHARGRGLPLVADDLLTDGGGQVLGLSRQRVQEILGRHGIGQVLAEEGGRTSRGSIGNMRAYATWLNAAAALPGFDLDAVERFWIERVRDFMAAKPFAFRLDVSLGFRAILRNLLRQVEERQREFPGTQIVGTVMQHLVGAKLVLVVGDSIEHHGSNQNDAGSGRGGDFDVHDVSIHVTALPGEAMVRKCAANLAAGRKPVIVTSTRGVVVAEALADDQGIADRVDIFDFEQFLASNVYELARFAPEARRIRIQELLATYNALIDAHETDKALRIESA